MLRPWKLELKINFESAIPIYLQIVDGIIDDIKSGKVQGGSALPGSRPLAKILEVNRNTVVKAIEILTAEGWLVSRERQGVFVANDIPNLKQDGLGIKKAHSTLKLVATPKIIFDDGIPDSKLAPMSELSRAYRRVFNQKARWKMMGYGNAVGTLEFREAIVQMLNYKRGLCTTVEEIAITRGSQMAMYLSAQVLLGLGDIVIVESPGYRPGWQAMESSGAKIVPVNVDSEGIEIEHIERLLKIHSNIKAVLLTPHHHYPTTVTLSLSRRLRLIELSNHYGFTIIEDDYDHDFHYHQRPVLPLSSHKEAHNCIYIGSMSKVVAPALRIGYVIGSIDMIQRIAKLRKGMDVQGDTIMELAVLDLIESGEMRRHIKRATSHYLKKRDFFNTLVIDRLKDKVSYDLPEGGLAFWLRPKYETDIFRLSENLLKKDIKIITPDKFGTDRTINGIRLGFASLSEDQLEKGVSEIAKCI
ncbi:PLP-dependent aminotransferase family protein [Aquimarina muelleri]|uniref:GntR family transcriptional regulator n=1 Tax=Aquimarina muelleri TaxID=279356 RepID=A0A918JYI7_9FLAO|nr:PLP-dependent aminotransferase family protein [Aquimarina muelleri]MCX2764895.1 PLP-dependent aminotransferase family protein [Aquimarina muelleri]GGX34400.1 GntR family transcriptional regulator [Aquimarina muelleri]